MLNLLRQTIIQSLWQTYRQQTPQMCCIEKKLHEKGVSKIYLDHFAVIDLPGPVSGIAALQPFFTKLGFIFQGSDYLADKQNDFAWLCEQNSSDQLATETLPQVVIADFRLDEMPAEIKTIIEKYAQFAQESPLSSIATLLAQNLNSQNLNPHDKQLKQLNQTICDYFKGRDWPLPTVKEYRTVSAFNELLAWVLVFGRRPNHFTLSVHLLDEFADLAEFNRFVIDEVQFTLNEDGGQIKGGKESGIAQAATLGVTEPVELADGIIHIPTGFVEFVWRFPKLQNSPPKQWDDYFTGFVANHANRVIESLYTPYPATA